MRLSVIIPLHAELDVVEYNAVIHNAKQLASVGDIVFICPYSMNNYVQKLFKHAKIINRFEKYQKTLKGYNKLLLSKEFYQFFSKYEYILICQSDVFVKNSESLPNFMKNNNHYSGAKFYANGELEIGNGGFSLRNTEKMLHCLNRKEFKIPKLFNRSLKWKIISYLEIYLPIIKKLYLSGRPNEDVIWSLFTNCNFKKVSKQDGVIFSLESNYLDLKSINDVEVIAFHAWQKHLPKSMQNEILETLGVQ